MKRGVQVSCRDTAYKERSSINIYSGAGLQERGVRNFVGKIPRLDPCYNSVIFQLGVIGMVEATSSCHGVQSGQVPKSE